ncbi:MAG: hypothetical protein QM775_04500 [Pirellulales bacterium]
MSEFLLPSVVVSLGVFAVAFFLLGRPDGQTRTYLLLLGVFCLGYITGANFLMGQAALFALAVAVVRSGSESIGAGRGALVVMTFIVLSGLVINRNWEHHHAQWQAEQLAEARQRYPLVSVADRLAYETKSRSPVASEVASEPITLADEVETRLVQEESLGRSSQARRALETVHRSQPEGNANFAYSIDSELSFLSYSRSEPARSISLTELPPKRGCEHPAPTPIENEYKPTPGATDNTLPLIAMNDFHHDAVHDFVDPETLGYVQDRDHVAGFQAHAFHFARALGKYGPGPQLKLEHLDLVSLQKPLGPSAYVSANYPNTPDLKTADTRLLEDFEMRALTQLRADKDVVIEEVEGSVRMLGALRAGNHCTGCHNVRRGELIGALSYEFLRESSTAPNPLIAQQQ